MKKCKYEQGYYNAGVHDINKDNYERYATPKSRYEVVEDGIRKAYAVCPFCDNPIMLHGILTTLKDRRPYGSHIRKTVKSFVFNHTTFSFCPAYTGRRTPNKEDRLDKMEPLNRDIYNSVRENLSSAIYILGQDLGLRLRNRAESLLKGYLAVRGYLYQDATLYNIPWMLLYFSGEYINLWRSTVIEGSWLYEFLKGRPDVRLVKMPDREGRPSKSYKVEKNTEWLDLRLDLVGNERGFVDDELQETIKVRISTKDYQSKYTVLTGEICYHDKVVLMKKLRINEYRYPNLIVSPNKIPDPKLEEMASRLMPVLEDDKEDE